MNLIPKLPPEAEDLFQKDLRFWLDRSEGEPKPTAADLLRTFWMLGQLAKLPQRTLIALECQNAEMLARDAGVLSS